MKPFKLLFFTVSSLPSDPTPHNIYLDLPCLIYTPLFHSSHRFSYGFTGFLEEGKEYDVWGLVKLDHHTAELSSQGKSSAKDVTALTWSSPYCFPSEAIFVPNPTDPLQEEDSGVLLSQVYDGVRQETFLLVLNPRDMKEMGRYYTGIRCPISFHGQYFQSILDGNNSH